MWNRLKNVKFSVFDPEKKKWIVHHNMSVLLGDCFIYAVSTEHLYKAVDTLLEDNNDYKSAKSEEERKSIQDDFFKDMLDRFIISEELQGLMYSSSIVWKIQLEDEPYRSQEFGIEE